MPLPTLTKKQKLVAEYLLCGFSNEEIAEEIGTTAGGVKNNHMRDMLEISGMDDRVGLAMWLHEHQEKLGIECPCKHGYCEGALLVMV
jgi:DNA-binding NarL/FixJ family response regulator